MTTAVENSTTDIGALIVSSPGVLGGKPCIRGHRVSVHRIARWWQLGLSVEEIGEKHPTLEPAAIHAALAYYHLHRAEVEGYLQEERVALETAGAVSTAV